MAKRIINEETWAKIRFDREVKGLTYGEIVAKYGVSKGAIFNRVKKENWSEPKTKSADYKLRESLVSQAKPRSIKPKKKDTEKPPSDDQNGDKKPTQKDPQSNDQSNKQSNDAIERNRTANRTRSGKQISDFEDYLKGLKQAFDPSRMRDGKNTSKNTSQSNDQSNDNENNEQPKELKVLKVDREISYIPKELEDIAESLNEVKHLLSQVKEMEKGVYHPNYAHIATKLCYLGGTPKDLAEAFQVTEQTIYNWLERHRDFYMAWEMSSRLADANVAKSVYRSAVGYNTELVESRYIQGVMVESVKIVHVPPNPHSQAYWLNNRRPQYWKSKVDYVEPVPPSAIDQEESDKLYKEALDKAEKLRIQHQNRAEKENFMLDGESED